jgi:hypothetical protein
MMGIRTISRLFFCAVLVAGSAGAQNLLTNGSFEEPVFGSSVNYPSTIPGWTTAPETFEVWNQLQGPGADGNQYLELDVNSCTTVSQTFATSTDNFYRVSLAFAARAGVQDNRIEVLWNGNVIGTASADGSAVSGNVQWTRHAYAVQQGAAGSSTLSIRNVDACDGLGSLIDDVSVVVAAPPASIPALGPFGIALLAGGCVLLARLRRRRA